MTYDPGGFATSANRFWSHSLLRPIVQPHGVKIRTSAAFTLVIDYSTRFSHTCDIIYLFPSVVAYNECCIVMQNKMSVFQRVTFNVIIRDLCECIPRSLLLPCHGQPAQLAPIKMFLYCLTSLSSQRGRKNFRCVAVFLMPFLKNWLTESHFQASS